MAGCFFFANPLGFLFGPSQKGTICSSGNWSLGGLSNFQRAIAGVKTRWIDYFLISLESSWNVDV
jgi:hypothetical protein